MILRKSLVVAAIVACLNGAGSVRAQQDNVEWKMDISKFQTSDDPYQGWKVVTGEAEVDEGATPPAVVLSAGSVHEASIYSYIPFFAATPERGPLYLQILARFNGSYPEAMGGAANVSEGGGHLGSFAQGLTTYSLDQHPFFTTNTEKKRSWALRFWVNKGGVPDGQVRIEGIWQTRELENGVTLAVDTVATEGKFTKGDQLRATFHTTDKELRKATTIPARLIALGAEKKWQVAPWEGLGGPDIELKKAGEGLFQAALSLDEKTVAFLNQGAVGTQLGIQVGSGEMLFTGWLYAKVQASDASQGSVDWQNQDGEDTGSHARWEQLTQGEELAAGKFVRLIPQPEYKLTTDENDPYDLTDGKLSTRKDDRIWFQKEAVGWYGAGGAIPAVTLITDLGHSQPIGQIAIRLLAGKEQPGLRLPNSIAFYASDDGKTYHLLQQMQKLMPAEQALSDMKTAFYVPEDGKAFVQAFACNEPVRARYVAIRIIPEASVFTDAISITKPNPKSQLKALTAYPAQPFFSEGVVARPRQPEFTMLSGVNVRDWIVFDDYNTKPYKDLQVEVEVPQRIRVFTDSGWSVLEVASRSPERRLFRIASKGKQRVVKVPFFFLKEGSDPLAEGESVTLCAVADGVPSHRVAYPLKERQLPAARPPEFLDLSLAWMGEDIQIEWPDFLDDFRQLGFGFVSTFPRNWQHRKSDRPWDEPRKSRSLKFLGEARGAGYRVVMNESPFHEMMHTYEAARREKTARPEDEGIYLRDAGGKRTDLPNPFYRGRFYQQEVARVKTLAQQVQPDHVYWDIELWWKSVANAKNDAGVREAWQQSGKKWEDFVTDAGSEMLGDLRQAVQEAMGERPMPVIGLYGAYAEQPGPTDGLFLWDKIYPRFVDISMPSLYVQGRTADVRNRIRNDFPKTGRNIIPWLTTATYGPVAPPAVESMVLEAVLNGARGVTYFQIEDFDPLHFYYHARAVATFKRFENLLKEGAPRDYQGSNTDLTYTCYASKDEVLILIGNYQRSPNSTTSLHPLFQGAEGAVVVSGELPDELTSASEWKVNVPPGGFVLFYQKAPSGP